MKADVRVEVDGEPLDLTNLDKTMYPAAGWTKAHVVDYYRRVAPVLLPHLRGRLLTMKRYPDGAGGEFFYAKSCPDHRPAFVRTHDVRSESTEETKTYCTVENLPTLVWLANLADLEMHVTLARVPDVQRPTHMVFDLDPGPPADVLDCARVGIALRDMLDRLGLASWIKTSGSKGLQTYVPLNTPATYDETKPFAHAMAQVLERERPDLVVSRMTKALRKGKVLVDWSQNDDHKTTVAAYSLRAKDRPTVSAPVTWDEVEEALRRKDRGLLAFEAEDVLRRVERDGDLFEGVLTRKQRLPRL